jgi:hypothetical protein
MAKKILIFLLAVMLVACLASCGEKDEVYTVTLKGENADYGTITITNGAPSKDLPTDPEIPAGMKDTHIFGYWYYINPTTGAERRVENTDALKNIREAQMIRTPEDIEEQRARITKLQNEAHKVDTEKAIVITLEGGLSEYAQ